MRTARDRADRAGGYCKPATDSYLRSYGSASSGGGAAILTVREGPMATKTKKKKKKKK
jgi:hypothetical protein